MACRARGHNFVMRLAEKAPDGTSCGPEDENSVCFSGECQVSSIALVCDLLNSYEKKYIKLREWLHAL